MHAAKRQNKSHPARQTSDNVIRRAQRHIRIVGIRALLQQSSWRIRWPALSSFSASSRSLRRIMSASDSMPAASVNAKSASGSLGFSAQPLIRQRSGPYQRTLKVAHQFGARFAVNAAQEFFLVQKKIAGQYSLPVKLLKQVAGGHGHFPKWFCRMVRFPFVNFSRASGNFCVYSRSNPVVSSGIGVNEGAIAPSPAFSRAPSLRLARRQLQAASIAGRPHSSDVVLRAHRYCLQYVSRTSPAGIAVCSP